MSHPFQERNSTTSPLCRIEVRLQCCVLCSAEGGVNNHQSIRSWRCKFHKTRRDRIYGVTVWGPGNKPVTGGNHGTCI